MSELRTAIELFKQFEEQVGVLLPTFKAKQSEWKWCIKKILSDHILIHLNDEIGKVHKIVWSRDGRVWELDSSDKFAQLVKFEGLNIADNLQEFLEIFNIFHNHRLILKNPTELKKEMVRPEKRPLLSKYKEMIDPPTCSSTEDKQQVKFWTIDSSTGHLEEWLVVQKGPELHLQYWIREKSFIFT